MDNNCKPSAACDAKVIGTSMEARVDASDAQRQAMQDAVKERRRARKVLRDEVKNILRREKQGEVVVEFGEFISRRRSFFAATRQVMLLAVAGQKISSDRNNFSGGQDTIKPKKTDLTKEIDSFFEVAVAHPIKPLRERLAKVKCMGEDNPDMRNLFDIVNGGKYELHAIGNMICHELIGLRSSRLSSRSGPYHRLSGGLARVILHLNDCARYQERPGRAVDFAQLLRIIDPGYAEAHMRIGLSMPLIPDLPNGMSTLRSFYHLCVFLVNRGVHVDSREAEVVRNAVKTAEKRLYELERQATPPEQLDLFAVRFISTCWTAVKGSLQDVRKLVVQSNVKLWNDLREIVEGWNNEPKSKGYCDGIEDAILYVVGIAIFVRHYLSTKLPKDDAFLEKRIAASDALLRNLSMVLCDSVCAGIRKSRMQLINRKKNRNRTRQRKRRNKSREEARKLEAPPLNEHRRLIFNEEVDAKIIPPAFGPVSFLLSFWSMTFSTVVPQQLPMYVQAYESLQNMLTELGKLTIHCGAEEFMNITRTKLATAEQRPCLKEDVLFSSFIACKNHDLFKNVVVRKVELNSFFCGDEDGMVDRAVTKIREKSYESVVVSSCVQHLRAFSAQIKQIARECCPEFTSMTAVSILVSTAIRQRRIELMIDTLSSTHGRIVELAAPTAPGGPPQREPRDVLETPPEGKEASRPLPGQLRPPAPRDTQDTDSADFERHRRKKRKLHNTDEVMPTPGTEVVTSQDTPSQSNAPSSSPPITVN